ncbi:M56 family metallopeptidase [Paenibacillus antibioticophila]|nr:M56 family metallopeptidase [Paenibacillus antibioticophila]
MLLSMLFLKGLELTLAGSVIAFLLLLIRRYGSKRLGPRIMCWLWTILLLKLLLPVSWSGMVSLENWTDPYLYDARYGADKMVTEAGKVWSGLRDHLLPQEKGWMAYSPMRMYQNGQELQVQMPAVKQELVNSLQAQTSMMQSQTVMAILWITGAVGVWCWRHWKSRGIRRWITMSVPFKSDELDLLLEDCRKEVNVRRPVRLMRSALPYPALHGWFRPVILLPYESMTLYGKEEMRLILLHELWHYKQRDILMFLLARFLRLVHWFNPLIRLALKRFEEDLEIRCDWRVLRQLEREEGLSYGLLLVRQGELNGGGALSSGPGLPLLTGASGISHRVSHVSTFLKRPHGKANVQRPWRILLEIGSAFMLALVLLPSSNLYGLLCQEQTPTLYAYWLEEGANPRDKDVISSMTAQMIGMTGSAVGDSPVRLVYQSPFEADAFQHTWNRLHLLIESEERPWPIQVDVRPIRATIHEQGLSSGNVLLMLHYPYRPIKYWAFSSGKKMMSDVPSLELLDSMKLY